MVFNPRLSDFIFNPRLDSYDYDAITPPDRITTTNGMDRQPPTPPLKLLYPRITSSNRGSSQLYKIFGRSKKPFKTR